MVGAQKLGVPSSNCLVFEDSLSGVQAAKAAGMKVVAIPDVRLERSPFEKLADEVLASMEEFQPHKYQLPNFATTT